MLVEACSFLICLSAEFGFWQVLKPGPKRRQVEEGLENAAQDYLADLKQDGVACGLCCCLCHGIGSGNLQPTQEINEALRDRNETLGRNSQEHIQRLG